MTDNSLHPLLSNLPDIVAYFNPLFPFSWISDNSKFCNSPVNFENKFQLYMIWLQKEAERLKVAREGSMEEISRLKLAEEELVQVINIFTVYNSPFNLKMHPT